MSDGGEAAFRHRHDGWTPLRQTTFLRTLRETGCVRSACQRVGLSSTSAYRVKRRIPEFGAAWDAALAYRLPALERAAYARAVEGWLEPIVYKGEVVAPAALFGCDAAAVVAARGCASGAGRGQGERRAAGDIGAGAGRGGAAPAAESDGQAAAGTRRGRAGGFRRIRRLRRAIARPRASRRHAAARVRHCERSEAIQSRIRTPWIASLRSQ